MHIRTHASGWRLPASLSSPASSVGGPPPLSGLLGGWNRRRVSAIALVAASIMAGCGGGGGGGSTPLSNNKILTVANLGTAVGVASVKSEVAGIAVPFAILSATSPTQKGALQRATPGLAAVPGMGLYVMKAVSGKTLTLSFFTDIAGKDPAGTIVATSNETLGSAYTYSPNPLTLHATGSITGGAIPLTADFTIQFTDAKGANTLVGTLDLPQDQVNLNLNLSLDDLGNVGSAGTISSTYTYSFSGLSVPTTTTMTNLVGTPVTPGSFPAAISGDATVSGSVPGFGAETGTGTADLNLATGSFNLTLTGGSLKGLLDVFDPGHDTLSVTPPGGGTPTTIQNVTSFPISSLLTVPPVSTPGYQAPVAIQGGNVTVEQTLGDGEMVGLALDSTNQTTGYYWPSPTAAPQPLDAPTGGSHTAAYGIATYSGQTVVVGSYQDASGLVQPCFWIDTSGAFKPYTASGSWPNGGAFQAISANGNTIVGYAYSSRQVQQPIAYISGSLYSLSGDGRSTNLRAIAVDNSNDILGAGDGGMPVPGVWPKASVDTTTSKILTAFKPLPGLNANEGFPEAFHISDNGVIAGGDGIYGLYWQSSDGFAVHEVPLGAGSSTFAYGINHAGTQFTGQIYAGSPAITGDLAYWPSLTSAPVDVSAKLGSLQGSYENVAGFFLLDDGSMIAISNTPKTTTTQFIYIQKK